MGKGLKGGAHHQVTTVAHVSNNGANVNRLAIARLRLSKRTIKGDIGSSAAYSRTAHDNNGRIHGEGGLGGPHVFAERQDGGGGGGQAVLGPLGEHVLLHKARVVLATYSERKKNGGGVAGRNRT